MLLQKEFTYQELIVTYCFIIEGSSAEKVRAKTNDYIKQMYKNKLL